MNNQVVKHLLGILLESPLYITLSRRERHRLVNDFIDLYAFAVDAPAGGSRQRLSVLPGSPKAAQEGRKAAR
jgi:hypothetical protein